MTFITLVLKLRGRSPVVQKCCIILIQSVDTKLQQAAGTSTIIPSSPGDFSFGIRFIVILVSSLVSIALMAILYAMVTVVVV